MGSSISAEMLAGGFRRLCSAAYQLRARKVQEFNDKHVSLGRAVEVIEDAASHTFPLHAPQGQFLWASLFAKSFIVVALFSCMRCCGCVCRCCGCRRGTVAEGREKAKAD